MNRMTQFKDTIPLGTVPTHTEEEFITLGGLYRSWIEHNLKVEDVKNLGAVMSGTCSPCQFLTALMTRMVKLCCFLIVHSGEETTHIPYTRLA